MQWSLKTKLVRQWWSSSVSWCWTACASGRQLERQSAPLGLSEQTHSWFLWRKHRFPVFWFAFVLASYIWILPPTRCFPLTIIQSLVNVAYHCVKNTVGSSKWKKWLSTINKARKHFPLTIVGCVRNEISVNYKRITIKFKYYRRKL